MKKRINMKKISDAVKAAYKEGRKWCKLDWGHYFQIRIDLSDAEIWCDTYISENEWSKYHSDTIQNLYADGYTVADKEAEYTTEAIRMLKEAGWEIIE